MPRQKWRGISIFVMTNPFEPPKKLALSDADLAEALAAAQGQEGSLGAMELLEKQSELRAADSHAYVQWVREMETLGTPEAKDALAAARRRASGLSADPIAEKPAPEVTEDSWKSLVPDWDERQESAVAAKEKAIADALALADEKAKEEIESAVAAAVAEAEFEAELKREEAVAKVKAEAEALAAEKLAEQVRIAEEAAAAEALAAEELRVEAERVEAERVEAERVEAERVEAERVEAESLRAEEVVREELERAELAALEAQIAAEELAKAEAENAEVLSEPETSEQESEPEPVRAADFATGSFDIIDSAEQAASEEFSEDNFEVLLNDGELGYAKEPAGSAKDLPISTIDRRAKPYSQLFVWSSLSIGLLPILFGYLSASLELSFVDKALSLFGGLVVSTLLIAVAAVGGKRSGLPTLYLSRAAFGVNANYLPAIAQVLVKLAFGATLLMVSVGLFDGTIQGLPVFSELAVGEQLPGVTWAFALIAMLLVVSSLLAFFGGKTLYFAQLGAAAVGAIATVIFGVLTFVQISLDQTDLAFTGNWTAVLGLAVLVSVVFGGFWISSVAEFTRKVSMAQSGKKLVLFVSLSAGVIPMLVGTFALMVSSSTSATFLSSFIANPLTAMFAQLPSWASSILLVSGVISMIVWFAAWAYSTSVSLSAISVRIRPALSQPILVLLTLAVVYSVATFATAGLGEILDAVIAICGVLVFAWAGIFVADISIRKIAYHEVSLTRDYGFYKSVNAVNLIAFVVAVALGLGFVSSTLSGFEWLGYLGNLASATSWSDANVGVLISLGFSVLFPLLFGRKRIRAQESEVLAIEARKRDLEHVELNEI
jgi:purine-cytosine permease-like protein